MGRALPPHHGGCMTPTSQQALQSPKNNRQWTKGIQTVIYQTPLKTLTATPKSTVRRRDYVYGRKLIKWNSEVRILRSKYLYTDSGPLSQSFGDSEISSSNFRRISQDQHGSEEDWRHFSTDPDWHQRVVCITRYQFSYIYTYSTTWGTRLTCWASHQWVCLGINLHRASLSALPMKRIRVCECR